MGKKTSLKSEVGRLGESSVVVLLITEWEYLEKQLEMIAHAQRLSVVAGDDSFEAIDQQQEMLVRRQEELLAAIANEPRQLMSDIMAKVALWKRCVAPGDAEWEQFSAVDRIALSAANDIEKLRASMPAPPFPNTPK